MYAGNPLAINYAQWLALFGRLLGLAKDSVLSSPVDSLEELTRKTVRGWSEIPPTCLSVPDEKLQRG